MRMASQCAEDDMKILDFCGRFVQKNMYVMNYRIFNVAFMQDKRNKTTFFLSSVMSMNHLLFKEAKKKIR